MQLLLDFKKLYPDYDLHMWSKWPSFLPKICALMKLEGVYVIYFIITKTSFRKLILVYDVLCSSELI